MTIFLRKLKYAPQNILVVRTDRVGDFILSLPVFQTLKERLGAKISILCQRYTTPLLYNNPFVDQVIAVASDKSRSSLIKQIKAESFDCLLVLANDPFILDLLPELKSIPVRVGPLSKLSTIFQYTHPALQKRSRSLFNEAEYNLQLLRIFGLENIKPIRPKIYFSEKESAEFRLKLNDTEAWTEKESGFRVVLHSGMGGSALNWSANSYSRLLNKLLGAGFNVVLTGAGRAEKERNAGLLNSLSKDLSQQVLDFTDKISLRELALLISFSGLFIGPSTGPTHLANAVATPVISLYPPVLVQSAIRWEPYLADSYIFTPPVVCGRRYKCVGEKCRYFDCMKLIDPEKVFAKAKEFSER